MKHKHLSFILFTVVLCIFIGGCTINSNHNKNEDININAEDAYDFLEAVYITEKVEAPNENCGISIPEDMPMEYFEMEVRAQPIDSHKIIDLLEETEIEAGKWVIIESLDEYSKVTLTMRIKWENTLLASKEVDLLAYSEDE